MIYDIPRDLESYQVFEMKCVIHKGNIDGRGELVQILPIGFNVKDTVIDDARMEFKNYTLNLYWDELPKDSVFEISYTVELDRIYGSLPLTSILYLEKTGKEYKFKTNVVIKRVEPVVAEEPIVADETETGATETPAGVEFRVQVRAAYKAQIPLQRLANKYALRDEIRENYIGNWYKYSVGSFTTFEEAKKYRAEIVGEHGVRDAFIVAFYNGERLNDLSELKQLALDAYPFKTSYKESGTCYRVQILAMKQGRVSPEVLKEIYAIEEEVNEEVYPNWHKYTVGKCTSKEEAKKLREKLVEKGIIDAFVVIYQNGERITYNGLIK
ncbi:MAG: SPOR domain-containing protein [Bacteroidales bacterium]